MHARAPRAALLAVAGLLVLAVAPLPASVSWAATRTATPSTDETPSPTAASTSPPSSHPGTSHPRAVGAPTASIASFDCTRLTVDLTLDNSRSTDRVTYWYTVSFQSPLHPPYAGADPSENVDVAAGQTTVVVLPVRDDASTTITIRLPDGGYVFSQRTCGTAPVAVFTMGDCDTLRLGLHLDNGSSTVVTRYRWTERDLAGQVASGRVEVAAGEVADVDVPLIDGTSVWVDVTVGDAALVATSAPRTCGRFVLSPRASFGALECADVSVPVLLDNSRSTARLRFLVPAHPDVVVGAGETQTLQLHLPIAQRLTVHADRVRDLGIPIDLASVSTTRCAAAAGDPRATQVPAAAATDVSAGRGDVASPETTSSGTTPLFPFVAAGGLFLGVGLAVLVVARRRSSSSQ